MTKSNGRGSKNPTTPRAKRKAPASPEFSRSQLRAIEYLATHPEKSQGDTAKALKVDPKTLWTYKQIKGFREAVTARAREIFSEDISAWLQAASKRAKSGDVPGLKLCLQLVGLLDADGPKIDIHPVIIEKPVFSTTTNGSGDPDRETVLARLNG